VARTADTATAHQLAQAVGQALELLYAVRGAQGCSQLEPWSAYTRALERLERALDASLTQPEQDRLLELLQDRQLVRHGLDGADTTCTQLRATLQRQRLAD